MIFSKNHRRKPKSQKLLRDLDLGGPGDLRSDLRGRPRPKIEKLRFYTEATEAEVLLKV